MAAAIGVKKQKLDKKNTVVQMLIALNCPARFNLSIVISIGLTGCLVHTTVVVYLFSVSVTVM
jgi:hypothetical protein